MVNEYNNAVLLVEDDREISSMLSDLLRKENFVVYTAAEATQMDDVLDKHCIDVAILDINLPGEDGLSICKRLSSSTDISILILTARHEEIDRIIGLEIGADDYLGKPFNPRELIARVRAMLRRRQKNQGPVETNESKTLTVSGLVIDVSARTVIDENQRLLKLSGSEFDLLCVLAAAKGRVLSRDHLMDQIHGREPHSFDRSIDVLVSRLRKKIDKGPNSLIESVRNAGYVIRDTSAAHALRD